MAIQRLLALAILAAAASNEVSAETLAPLKPGEAIAIMPDGTVSRVTITDAERLKILNANAKRIEYCSMFMVDNLGFVARVNTNPHDPMVVCEEIVKPQ